MHYYDSWAKGTIQNYAEDKSVLLPRQNRSGQECQRLLPIQSQLASAPHSEKKKKKEKKSLMQAPDIAHQTQNKIINVFFYK